MSALLDSLALLVTAGGLVAAGVCLVVTRRPRLAMPVLLDMLTAAGLLRLTSDPSFSRSFAAAAIVAVRHLLVFGLKPYTGHR